MFALSATDLQVVAMTAPISPLPRIAGALYLVIILCGIWSEGFVRAALIEPDDAAATAEMIGARIGLFRASLVADTAMAVADVALAVVFLMLLRAQGEVLALIATAFRLVQAALIGASLVALGGVPAALELGEDGLALGLTAIHAGGYDLGLVFFGVTCFAMCALLRRSGGVPAAIAWGIGASGVVYIAGSLLRLAAPEWHTGFQPAYVVPLVSESALCLWLLLRGRI